MANIFVEGAKAVRSTKLHKAEREYLQDILDNPANRRELMEEVPSLNVKGGGIHIAEQDTDSLINFMEESVRLREKGEYSKLPHAVATFAKRLSAGGAAGAGVVGAAEAAEPDTSGTAEKPAVNMQYSLKEVEQKFLNAHQAGDTMAAQALADEVKRLRALSDSHEGVDVVDPGARARYENPYLDHDLAGGLQEGLEQNFSGSIARLIETNLPAWASGRLFAQNPETGEYETLLTTAEWLGISDEEWSKTDPKVLRDKIHARTKQLVDKTWASDRDSGVYMASKITGMLIDPTTKIPLVGSWKAMALKGSALGITDAAAWEYAQKGEINPETILIGGLAGAAPGLIKGGYQGTKAIGSRASSSIKNVFKPKEVREARNNLDAFWRVFEKNKTTHESITAAYTAAKKEAKVNHAVLSSWAQAANKRTTSKVAKALMPISDRIYNISPSLHRIMVGTEQKILETSHTVMSMGDPFLKQLKRLERKDPMAHRAIKKAMLDGKTNDLMPLIEQHLGAKGLADHAVYKQAMDDMWDLVASTRKNMAKRVEQYTHRAVKDYRLIKDFLLRHGREVDVARIKTIAKKEFGDRTPTDEEMNALYSRFLDGIYDAKHIKQVQGATKGRAFKRVPEELVDAFHHPDKATHSYVRSMVEDSYKRRLFGKAITDEHGDNLTKSVAAFVNKEHKAGRLKSDDIEELKTLLELRFSEGTRKPLEIVQKFKDYSYAMLLGNPISAATQLGDVFLAAWKTGIGNAAHGFAKAITGKGLRPKEWGLLDNMLEEMVSTGKSKKWLRLALSHGNIPVLRTFSFQNIDRIGKATLMNGALRKYQRMAMKNPAKLKKLWGEAYGDDFNKLVDDLKASARGAEPSGDVKSLVFADLSDMQPVTLLEMPEAYLRNPNGRIIYMLRTFQLKYMNLLYKTARYNWERGDRLKALFSTFGLAAMFSAGGFTSDMVKHAILNRDPDLEELAVDNILANTGIFHSRYQAGKIFAKRGEAAGAGRPISNVINQMLPPANVFDPFAYAFAQTAMGEEITMEDKARMMSKIPIVGRILENYGFGGRERFADRKFREGLEVDL